MPAQAEVYTNQPTGTVTSGGTTTSDTAWTVNPTVAFPVASTTPVPNTVFRAIDPALPSEIILVTVCPGGTGSQSWTVARAQEGTSGVAHASNWTVVQTVSGGSLGSFVLKEMGASSSVTQVNTTTTETALISWQPPVQDYPAAGVAYQFTVFGTLGTSSTAPVLTLRARWGGTAGTALCSLASATQGTAMSTSMSNAGFWANGYVICLSSTSMIAGMSWLTHKTATVVSGATASGDGSAAMAGITVSGNGPLVVTATWTTSTSNTLYGAGVCQRVQ
jgi:hypothetical protein